MAIVLDATVGGVSSNAFVVVATADTYLEARANASSWASASNTTKEQCVISATRALNAMQWKGRRVASTQALAWPRYDVWDGDRDALIEEDVIPSWLQDATCELAFETLRAGTSDVYALPAKEGVIEETIGPLTTRWADPFAQKTGLRRYPMVWQLIARFVLGGGMQVSTVRG